MCIIIYYGNMQNALFSRLNDSAIEMGSFDAVVFGVISYLKDRLYIFLLKDQFDLRSMEMFKRGTSNK